MSVKETPSPFGSDTTRYWQNRHLLFSRWAEGIQTDKEGLFSVKPEFTALQIARTLPGSTVLDAFCGIGGTAIAFARTGKKVLAVDIDEERVSMARNNARIYGVEAQITFLHDDVHRVINTLHYESLYLDPSWGGPDYYRKESFSWSDFAPTPLPLIKDGLKQCPYVAISVPVNFNLANLLDVETDFYLQKAHQNGRLLFMTVYFCAAGASIKAERP